MLQRWESLLRGRSGSTVKRRLYGGPQGIVAAVNSLDVRIKEPVALTVFGRSYPRCFPAAKRQRHIHARGGRIELEYARFGFVQESLLKFSGMAEETGN